MTSTAKTSRRMEPTAKVKSLMQYMSAGGRTTDKRFSRMITAERLVKIFGKVIFPEQVKNQHQRVCLAQ
jgi:hypothetical protein